MATVARIVVNLTATTHKFTKAFGQAQKVTEKFIKGTKAVTRDLDEIARYGRKAALSLTALGYATSKVVKAAADHEESMLRVKAVSRATVAEYQALSKTALDLSTTTRHSLAAIGDGMKFLAMAGFRANEIIKMIPVVTKMATAGAVDMATAADITTNIVAGYGMEIEDLSRATDVLVSAFTGANVNLELLGETFKHAGPVAKSAGVQFEEVAAAAALLGNAGIQGSIAGTSLKSAFSRLLSPSGNAARILRRLGVETITTEGKLRSLADIIEDLNKAGATTADVLQIFGLRAGPSMARLLDVGADTLRQYTDRLLESEGIAELIETEQMQSFNAQLQIMKNSLNALAVDLGNDLLPVMKTLNYFVTDLVQGWRDMDETQKQNIFRIGLVSAAVLGLITTLGLVASALSVVVKGFTILGIIVSFVTSGPVVAIAAIITVVELLRKAWEEDWKGIRTTIESVWETIGPIIKAIAKWGKETVTTTWNWVSKHIDAFLTWVSEVAWPWINNTVRTTWSWLTGIIGSFLVWVKDVALPWINDTIRTTWNWFGKVGSSFIVWVKEVALPWINDAVKTTWNWFLGKVDDFITWIKDVALPWINKAVDTTWDWTLGKVDDFITWIKDVAAPWLDGVVTTTWEWITKDALPQVLEKGEVVIKAVLEFGGEVYEALQKGLNNGEWGDFWSLVSEKWSQGVLIGITLSSAVQGITAVISAIQSGLGVVAATGSALGLPGVIGLMTIGIQLAEAWSTGEYKKFAANLIASLSAALAVYGLTGSIQAGTLAFNITMNINLGENLFSVLESIFSWIRHNFEALFDLRFGDLMFYGDYIKMRTQERLAETMYAENLQHAISWIETLPYDRQIDRIAMAADVWGVDEAELRKHFLPMLLDEGSKLLASLYDPSTGWAGRIDVFAEEAQRLGVSFDDLVQAVDKLIPKSTRIEDAVNSLNDTLGVDLRDLGTRELALLLVEHDDFLENYGLSTHDILNAMREIESKTVNIKDVIRSVAQSEDFDQLRNKLEQNNIVLDDFLIRLAKSESELKNVANAHSTAQGEFQLLASTRSKLEDTLGDINWEDPFERTYAAIYWLRLAVENEFAIIEEAAKRFNITLEEALKLWWVAGGPDLRKMKSLDEVITMGKTARQVLGNFASGGYTGNYPVDQVVGVVHGQEIVIPAPAVRRGLGGILEWLGVPGFQKGTPVVIDGLAEAQANITNMENLFNNLIEAFLTGISKLFEIILKAIETIAVAIVGEEKAQEIKARFKEFQKGIEDLIGTISKIPETRTEDGQKPVERVVTWLEKLANAFYEIEWRQPIDNFVSTLANGLAQAESYMAQFVGEVTRLMRVMVNKTEEDTYQIEFDWNYMLQNMVNGLANMLAESIANLFSGYDTGFAQRKDPFPNLTQLLENVEKYEENNRKLAQLQRNVDLATVGGGALGAGIGFAVGGPLGALIGGFLGALGGRKGSQAVVNRQIEELTEKLKDDFLSIKELLGTTMQDVANALGRAFSAETYEDFVHGFSESLENQVRNALVAAFMSSDLVRPLIDELSNQITWAVTDREIDAQERDSILNLYNQIIDVSGSFFNSLQDLGIATGDVADKMKELSGAMRNVPQGLKIVSNRLAAAGYSISGVRAMSDENYEGGRPVEVHNHFHGNVYGMDDFERKVKEATAKNNRSTSLATYGV